MVNGTSDFFAIFASRMAKGLKVGFKESVADFAALSKDIAAKKFAPIYLLMGDEGYFIDKLSDQLAEGILGEAERAFNQIMVYGKDSECGDIINFARQMPMMGSYQVVIVKEAQQLRKIDQLAIYTKNPSPTTILVLCHKEKNIDKRSQLYKQIEKIGVVFESVRPRDYELGQWLGSFIQSKGCNIDHKALGMLVEHLGVDIAKISNEIDKLLTCLPEGTKNITPDHIENNIGISKDFNNFELTKALSEKNIARAMMIAEYFARNPKDNPLTVTLSTMFAHYQRIFTYNYQRWLTKNKGIAMPPDMELSKMLKLPTPFFLTEYKQAATLYPNKSVFTILGMLREYDMRSKGMNNGNMNDGELLKELLLKIFAL